MSIVDLLLVNAESDHDLLAKNVERGDHVDVARDLDFVLYAKDQERAQLVADFVRDNRYGHASVEGVTENGGSTRWRLVVVVNAPCTEHVVCALSGFMACVSKLFDLDYDGWGCVLQ